MKPVSQIIRELDLDFEKWLEKKRNQGGDWHYTEDFYDDVADFVREAKPDLTGYENDKVVEKIVRDNEDRVVERGSRYGSRIERIAGKIASVERYCSFWKASNGKWYLDLADREHGEYRDATTYGPFPSEEAVDKFLSDNFSNPGGMDIDDSGEQSPPHKSPNGDPVRLPRSNRMWSSERFGKIASRVAVKFDTKKEIQVYKQEHHPEPGTKLQVRNQHEREQRNKDKA